MAIATSILLGIGLAAASGFRVFLPLLALSIAAHLGMIPLSESWTWVGSFPAIITLGVAGFVEIVAYYIPWLDNILDSITIPLAAVAGTAAVAATTVGMDPLLTWSLAIIAGGGTAGAIGSATASARVTSTATTAGLGNPIVSTAETGASITLTLLALFVPVVAVVLAIVMLYFIWKALRKISKKGV